MGQHHHFNISRINAERFQIGQNFARAWLHISAAAGFNQSNPPCRPDQKGIHCGAPRWAEIFRQDLARFIFTDVAQNIQIAIQKTITNGRDDDIPDAAVIYPWNLGGWRVLHPDSFPQAIFNLPSSVSLS